MGAIGGSMGCRALRRLLEGNRHEVRSRINGRFTREAGAWNVMAF